ncbi:MAG: hypothetical protein J5604_05000 [Bacteroidales bacterium]|nr:hypothetical protein [Bacteroidales bacterium]
MFRGKLHIILLLLSFFTISCDRLFDQRIVTRDSHFSDTVQSQSGLNYLPIDLLKYNQNAKTKSSGYSFQEFNIDSLIYYEGVKQKYYEDCKWVYTEFPLRINGNLYASLTNKTKIGVEDSLVSIKCYLINADNIDQGNHYEYFATIIPTKRYSDSHTLFSFLEKPNFCGVILYSNPDGSFIRSEYYDKGQILFTTLKPADSPNTKSFTKSNDDNYYWDLGYLNSITVFPNSSSNCSLEDFRQFISEYLEQFRVISLEMVPEMNYIEGNEGGGSPAHNNETYCIINYRINQCNNSATVSRYVEKGNDFAVDAPLGSYSCMFMCWVSSPNTYSTNSNVVMIENVQENEITLEAKYTSPTHNPECYELMQTLAQSGRLLLLGCVFDNFSSLYEYICTFDGDSIYTNNGSNNYSQVTIPDSTSVKSISHTHNHGFFPFPSGTDFIQICKSLIDNNYYPFFTYDITTSLGGGSFRTMMISVENRALFIQKIMNKSLEELELKYTKKFQDLLVYNHHYYENPQIHAEDYYNVLLSFLQEFGLTLDIADSVLDQNIHKLYWSEYDPKRGSHFIANTSYDMNTLKNCFTTFSN